MLIDGSKTLAADRATVWRVMADADFLRATIPDCRSLRALDDDRYEATLVSAVGPVRAAFDVTFRREVEAAMQSYVLVGEGNGGLAGTAQGRIHIALSDIQGGTLLSYSAETVINGKLAQLGSRLIDSAARKFSERFFANVQKQLNGADQAATGDATDGGAADGKRRSPDTTTPDGAAIPGAVNARACGAARAPIATAATADGRLSWWLPLACGIGCFAGTFLAGYLR